MAEFSSRPTRRSQSRKVQRLRIQLPSAPLHARFEGRSGSEETVAIEVSGSKADPLPNANPKRRGHAARLGVLSGPGGAAITATISGAAVFGTVTALSLTWRDSMPRWAVPLLGGTVFLGLTDVWLTSSLWSSRARDGASDHAGPAADAKGEAPCSR